jgi:hypothetical protein
MLARVLVLIGAALFAHAALAPPAPGGASAVSRGT